MRDLAVKASKVWEAAGVRGSASQIPLTQALTQLAMAISERRISSQSNDTACVGFFFLFMARARCCQEGRLRLKRGGLNALRDVSPATSRKKHDNQLAQLEVM